jgi:ankyrin repeat protein
VAKALIAAGADVNQQNKDGSTALLTAALFCRSEIVEALLDAGADKRIRSNTGSTALAVVGVPFDEIKPVYDYIRPILKQYGLELDYERIKRTRPGIAEMLR